MFAFKDKTALVTGATGGIGAAVARAFHALGATVVVTGRNDAALESLKSELGDRVHAIRADLADPAAPKELVSAAFAAAGRIDILVNNAGLNADMLALRMKDEAWDSVIAVNLTASFKLVRECLAPMVKNRYGRIINITSVVGETGNAGQANYAASKAGLAGMTKSIAVEVACRGITANCIAPGFIATAMTDALSDEMKGKILAEIPAGRFGTPDDVAACAVFLASEEASYVTGQTLHVNGGQVRV